MAKNTGENCRKGAVIDRTQIYNEKTGQYVKRNTKTGQFISSKDTPYKGVSLEKKTKN